MPELPPAGCLRHVLIKIWITPPILAGSSAVQVVTGQDQAAATAPAPAAPALAPAAAPAPAAAATVTTGNVAVGGALICLGRPISLLYNTAPYIAMLLLSRCYKLITFGVKMFLRTDRQAKVSGRHLLARRVVVAR